MYEIFTQCRYTEVAYLNISKKSEYGIEATFSSIHSFLSHCAMVSKLLWSSELAKNSKNKTIAKILEVSGNSKIKSRKFRNILEHFDIYLVKWYMKKGKEITILDHNIGPKNAIKFDENSNVTYIRHYDSAKNIFTLLDKELNLRELFDEILKIKTKSIEWVRR